MRHIYHFLLFLPLLLAGLNTAATTPHSISIGDATNDFDNGTENLGSESGRTGYLTWDATKLYIGVTGNPLVGTLSNLYVVIDLDPATNSDPRTGAGRSDQPTNESGGATYPFNADLVYRFDNTTMNDGGIVNPAPGAKYTVGGGAWSSVPIGSGVRIRRHSTDITDLEIPFSDLGISSNANFNVIFYIANVGTDALNSNFAQWPTNNPNGNAVTLTHYYTYKRSDSVVTNAQSNLSIRLTVGGFSFGESSLANLAVLGASQTYNCGALTTIHHNLFIGSTNTFTMGSNIAALNISGNITNNGVLTLSSAIGGDMGLSGNFTQNGTFNGSDRALTFQGTSQQTISGSGSTAIDYMTINNAAGVALSRDVTVDNQLTLSNGVVTLGANTLTINSSGSITGTFSAGRMIAADGAGFLRRNIAANGDYLFPVGDVSGPSNIAEYAPVEVKELTASNYSSAYVQVNLDDIKHPNVNINAIDFLSRYWTVEASGTTLTNYDIYLTYLDADVNGTEADIVLGKRTGSTWTQVGTINTGTNRLEGLNITSFSEFTGGEPAAFPIELLNFDALPDARCVNLHWRTASEQGNDRFEIERSADARTWHTLGSLTGAGYSTDLRSYTFIDEKPLPLNFYRLKQVDYDGKHEYSKIISATFGQSPAVRILPNPATHELHLQGTGETFTALIFDQNGSLKQQASTNIIVIEDLIPGVYFIKILDEAGQSLHVERFVKQ